MQDLRAWTRQFNATGVQGGGLPFLCRLDDVGGVAEVARRMSTRNTVVSAYCCVCECTHVLHRQHYELHTMQFMLMGTTTIGHVYTGLSVDVCGSHMQVDACRSHMHADRICMYT
jgi:hypothetical protein